MNTKGLEICKRWRFEVKANTVAVLHKGRDMFYIGIGRVFDNNINDLGLVNLVLGSCQKNLSIDIADNIPQRVAKFKELTGQTPRSFRNTIRKAIWKERLGDHGDFFRAVCYNPNPMIYMKEAYRLSSQTSQYQKLDKHVWPILAVQKRAHRESSELKEYMSGNTLHRNNVVARALNNGVPLERTKVLTTGQLRVKIRFYYMDYALLEDLRTNRLIGFYLESENRLIYARHSFFELYGSGTPEVPLGNIGKGTTKERYNNLLERERVTLLIQGKCTRRVENVLEAINEDPKPQPQVPRLHGNVEVLGSNFDYE